MRVSPPPAGLLFVAASLVACVAVIGACTPGGSYEEGNERDAGPGPEVVTFDAIGTPCVYDPSAAENPSNQCPRGTECLMAAPGVNPAGMALTFWEDQFTVALPDGTFEGYCTVLGNLQAPPSCPQGTFVKAVRSAVAPGGFALFCLKPCASSAECGGNRVCDTRFLDVGTASGLVPACVKPCFFDMPDCAFTAVVDIPTDDGAIPGSVVDTASLFGGGTCARDTGICQNTQARGTGDEGAPCRSASDCKLNAACFQDELFGKDRNDGGVGFCATRCLLTQEGSRGCAAGSVCQPGLTFGYEREPISGGAILLRDSASGQIGISNGVCFAQCSVGLDTCDAFPGTHCDAIDGAVMGANTVGVSMCVPNEVSLQQQ